MVAAEETEGSSGLAGGQDEPDERGGEPDLQAPDRSRLFQLIGGAVALIAITAVVAVLLTRSMLQAPEPEVAGRLRGMSFDSFNRADGSPLETTETGRPWQIVGGEWSVSDGRVEAKPLPGPAGGGGSALAVLDTGVGDQFVQATFFDPKACTGLVTRFQGPNNFIGVTFAPVTGTVQLGVTVDGTQAQPSQIGSALPEGEVTLGVRTEGKNVIVYVNGAESGRQVVPELTDGTRVGLLVRGGAKGTSTSIDNVVAVPLSTEKIGALGGLGAATSTTVSDGGAKESDQPDTTSGGPAPSEPAADGPAGPATSQSGAPTPGAVEPAGGQ